MKLIKNADIYAPQHLGHKDILICANRIEWIRDHIDINDPQCEIIDASGLTLTPGFVDQHIHITGGGGEGSFHTRAPEVNLSELIRGGITTVIGLLGTDNVTRSVENLLAKAKALKEEGISCYILTGSYGYPSITLTGDVKKDLAFIEEVIGVKLALSDHRAPNVTLDELIRLASDVRTTAMVSGKPGIITLHMGDDPRALSLVFEALDKTSIPVGLFRPTHLGRADHLFEDAIKLAKRGGFIDITCAPGSPKLLAQLKKAEAEGVDMSHVTLSSDGQGSWSNYDAAGNLLEIGVSSVESLHDELITLIKYGYSLEQALPFITSNVADALKLTAKGHVREGADADLILMDDKYKICTVIALGQTMMQDGRVIKYGTFEKH